MREGERAEQGGEVNLKQLAGVMTPEWHYGGSSPKHPGMIEVKPGVKVIKSKQKELRTIYYLKHQQFQRQSKMVKKNWGVGRKLSLPSSILSGIWKSIFLMSLLI